MQKGFGRQVVGYPPSSWPTARRRFGCVANAPLCVHALSCLPACTHTHSHSHPSTHAFTAAHSRHGRDAGAGAGAAGLIGWRGERDGYCRGAPPSLRGAAAAAPREVRTGKGNSRLHQTAAVCLIDCLVAGWMDRPGGWCDGGTSGRTRSCAYRFAADAMPAAGAPAASARAGDGVTTLQTGVRTFPPCNHSPCSARLSASSHFFD